MIQGRVFFRKSIKNLLINKLNSCVVADMTIALSIFKVSFIYSLAISYMYTCIFITSTPSSTRTPTPLCIPPSSCHLLFFVTWCITAWNVNWVDLIPVSCRYYCSKFMSATAVPCPETASHTTSSHLSIHSLGLIRSWYRCSVFSALWPVMCVSTAAPCRSNSLTQSRAALIYGRQFDNKSSSSRSLPIACELFIRFTLGMNSLLWNRPQTQKVVGYSDNLHALWHQWTHHACMMIL